MIRWDTTQRFGKGGRSLGVYYSSVDLGAGRPNHLASRGPRGR